MLALLRVGKPAIAAALTLAGFTGMVTAAHGPPQGEIAVSCLTSLFLMSTAAAVVNNVLDRAMDEEMERVSKRSEALRCVGSGRALSWAFALALTAIAISAATLNPLTTLLLVAASAGYAFHYTVFLKRRTPWGALFGIVPGALPVLIGQSAVSPAINSAALALFLVMVVWQPPHFWLLSLAHLDQYRTARIPVLPVAKGIPFTAGCIYLGVAALFPALFILYKSGAFSLSFLTASFAVTLFYYLVCYRVLSVGPVSPAPFRMSIAYLLLIFLLVIAGHCL
nr:protoheme IX farnesyltransferase [Geomonas sp. Red32]